MESKTDPTLALAKWPNILGFRDKAIREDVWNYIFVSHTALHVPTKLHAFGDIRFGRAEEDTGEFFLSITGSGAFEQLVEHLDDIDAKHMLFLDWVCESFLRPIVDNPPTSGREKSSLKD